MKKKPGAAVKPVKAWGVLTDCGKLWIPHDSELPLLLNTHKKARGCCDRGWRPVRVTITISKPQPGG